MRRVTWPNRKQVEGTTAVVIFSVFAFAAYFCDRGHHSVEGRHRAFWHSSRSRRYMEAEENVHFDEQPDADPRTSPRIAAEPAHEEPASEEQPREDERGRARKPPAKPPRPPATTNRRPRSGTSSTPIPGFEHKVAESLRTRAEAFGFADKIGQILIPTEEVVELRNGKKVTSKRLLYPGYVVVEMEMNDELWHAVKNTPRVTGFVGGGKRRCR